MAAPVRLSIATTMYKSAGCVAEFCRRAAAAAAAVTPDYEIVLVDDGSPDNSLEVARAIARTQPNVRVVGLSRNFGHHKALMTAVAASRGELVFLIDSDLEVAPEVLAPFAAEMSRTSADVVYGVQDERRDGWIDRWGGRLFYSVFNWLSKYPLPRNLTTARLMTRRYVDSLLAHQEHETIIAGLWVITGYAQVPVVVEKTRRKATTYSLASKVVVLANAITSFSDRPLILIFWLGVSISTLSALFAITLVARRLLYGTVATGWLSLIVSMWLVGGLMMFALGIIGIYLSRIFIETKRRPYVIIRESDDPPASPQP